jgi:Stress responsive A/B Barrel Domain
MFVHHVFFWLKPEASTDELIAGLKTLTDVEGLVDWHIGIPADTNREVIDRSYSVSWLTMFESAADEAVYQTHPVHLAFVDNCKHLWERVLVYDSVPID